MLPRVEPVTAPGRRRGRGRATEAGHRRGARAWRDGGSTPPRPSSRSTACAPTARARRHRASTGPRWPGAARWWSGGMVAELDSAPLVVLDCSSPASEEALDMAVRAAGSLCVHLARTERLRDPAPGRAPPGGDRARHGRLAVACTCASRWSSRGRRRPPRRWRRAAGRCSGSPPPTCGRPARARAAARRGALRGRARNAPAGAAVAFEVAGCSGCRLGRAGRRVAA